MDGFLDTSTTGVTELRVHGVSGTPPGPMLDHPYPRLVAGDGTTGFYRRWWPAGRPRGQGADVPGVRHREAYAWGGLTSGGRTNALWLLLLPFSMANLAYFMLPRPAGGRRLRHTVEAAQRLFALLLTGTLVGALVGASVDLVGWQCTAAGRACAQESAPVWVRWLSQLWGTQESRRLAVTALVPLAVVGVLWAIARRTWRRDERTVLPPSGPGRPEVLLARRRLWHGGVPVWRLRNVHIAFALGAIGLAVSAPFARSAAGLALTVANAAVQVAAVVLVILPGIARRVDPEDGDAAGWLSRACRALGVAAPVLFLVTFGWALAGLPSPEVLSAQLPGVGSGTAQVVLTMVLAVVIGAGTWALARMDRAVDPGTRPAMGGVDRAVDPGTRPAMGRVDRAVDASGRPAMGGMASWFTLMAAAGSANALALGLLFWTASFFGTPESPSRAADLGGDLFLDDPVWWTAALVPVMVAGVVLVAVVLWRIREATTATLAPKLTDFYGGHASEVAGKWSLAALSDRAGLVLGLLVGAGLTGFAVVTVIYRLRLVTPVEGTAGLFATLGSWAMATLAVGLVLLGRRSYSDSRLRRTVGILWDVSTFWPRAIHPLSPPCYTERVIPELVSRVEVLTREEDDQVLISGHSQGSVIAAALVLQLDPAVRERVRLLTHGSPLRRLYAAFFPAYFGTPGLSAVRAAAPWVNLYRLSDPIGGPVFDRADPFAPANRRADGQGRDARADRRARDARADGRARGARVDVFCWDPPLREAGEPLAPARWHVDYWFDPPYDEALGRLTGNFLP
ncbi:hypothetical protein [Nonomuraea glycinis]|uniref:hypothetical protein n=1 Tax=Nonomuraea glycinis TaxID=2047744 RepID=UPI002E146AF2|nr:hypothetical protein OHA68_37975 [Nonomuraea glycinis]